MCFLVLSGRRPKGKAGVAEELGSNQAAGQSRERGEPASVAALENLARESRGEDTQRGVAR